MSADVDALNHLRVDEVTPQRHSGLGIASLLIGVLFGSLLVSGMLLSGYGHLKSINESLYEFAAVLMLVSLIEVVHGVLFGLAGLYFSRRKRLFAWLGIATNGVALLFSLTVLAIGVHQS